MPSSDSIRGWKYDVFLSFRGADTRKGFTDHLYTALERDGIHTFRDDDEIRSGEEIETECLQAIEESRFSIVVLSRRYATSSWCLDELVHMLKCRTTGHAVWAVFYDVDPSDVEELEDVKELKDVEKLKGCFADAFKVHAERCGGFAADEERYKKEKNRFMGWKDALLGVAYLKGLDLRKHLDGHEARNIDYIVKEISARLDRTQLSVVAHPVGLEPRAKEVISLLAFDVRIVGIYGMGGIGKTSIAKRVYDKIFHNFDGRCFVENVREQSISKGVAYLQRQILSQTLKRKYLKIDNVGLNLIKERLCRKRVLIVLDDVDKIDQLTKIVGNCEWLSPESRVIITTRTKNLLPSSKFYRQYMVMPFDKNDSLQLLCLHAFDQCHPPEDYNDCAERVVSYAGGIPLGLEVLGSSLNGEDIDIWNSRLEKLDVIGSPDIHNILETSYDSLDHTEKFLFLDIVCFFIGNNKDYVIAILHGCRFFPADGINTLIKKNLLQIGPKRKLMMHDLLRDMGREMVLRESPMNPGKRSRLWDQEDVMDVLTHKTGTVKVEGLILNLQLGSNCAFESITFKKMKILRLLQLDYTVIKGSCEHISYKLRWLCWRGFPSKFIPSDLHLANLIALDMRYSSLVIFSEEVMYLKKLKFLNLSHSHKLSGTPDFEGLPSLEKLMLKDCISLEVVDKSIGYLTRLVVLNLQDCKSLKKLPDSICLVRSLVKLNMSGCSELGALPENFGNLFSLVELLADKTAISTLPGTFAKLINLENLSLRGCPLIFTPNKSPCSILPSFLKELDIRHCTISDDDIPLNLHHGLRLLEDLKLCGNNFTRLPASIGSLPKLDTLWLNECRELQYIPHLQQRLRTLHANDCPSLVSVNLKNFMGESDLEINGCANVKEVGGFFKLEPLGVQIVRELLKDDVSFTQDTIANISVRMIDNLTQTYRISPLQALYERGIYSIFVPGSEIPKWFSHRNEGDTVSFKVPPLSQGSEIIGFATCAIYAWKKSCESCFFNPDITIINRTKMFHWLYTPYVTFLASEVDQDIMWLGCWLFDAQMKGMDDMDMNWRFKDEMDQGDLVEFSLDFGFGIVVRRCGIQLLYQGSQANDLTTIAHTSSKYHKRFMHSRARWLTIGHQNEITSQVRKEHRGEEYFQWSRRRKERMNQTPTYDSDYMLSSQTVPKSIKQSVPETLDRINQTKSKEEPVVPVVGNEKNLAVHQPSLESTEQELPRPVKIFPSFFEAYMREKLQEIDTEETVVQPTVAGTSSILTEPQAQSEEVGTASSFNDPEAMKGMPLRPVIPNETRVLSKSPIPMGSFFLNMIADSKYVQSFTNVQIESQNMLEELSCRNRTQLSSLSPGNFGSNPAPRHNFVQQKREALKGFFSMSLEAIQHANAFENIERIVLTLVKHSTDLLERTFLEDLSSRLAKFRESVPYSMTVAETAQALRTSLPEKAPDLNSRLIQKEEQIKSLKAQFSRISEEEAKLEAQIQQLISKKEELVVHKKSVALELEKTNQEASKVLQGWKSLEGEVQQANVNWLRAKEELAQSNASWKLFKDNLGL